MGQRLHQIVAALLVLMHLAVGHAAGSRVCLGGGACHRVGVMHLGFGHSHENEGHGAEAGQAPATGEVNAEHGHRHVGGRHDQGGGRHGGGPNVAATSGTTEWVGLGGSCEGADCDRDCEPGGCECADAWVPAVRGGEKGCGDRGDDLVGPLVAIACVPVAVVVGGVPVERVVRLVDQRPPGLSLGLRSTVLLI